MQPLFRAATRTSRVLPQLPRAVCARSFTSRINSFLPIPLVVSDYGGQRHATDLFSRLLMERVVCVYGEVEETMSARITASLLFLEAEAPDRPIYLYINSPGGSVTAGLALYDTMQYITPEVHTICLGQAASMGSLILAAGAPGKRSALPHSSIMVHQPSGGFHGQASDIAIHAKEILRIRGQLNQIYKKHIDASGKKRMSVEDIEKLLERDHFMSAQEALDLGLVDEILTSRKQIPEPAK